jgi:hypothetical protein
VAELVLDARVRRWKPGYDEQPDDHREECRRDDHDRAATYQLLKEIEGCLEQVGSLRPIFPAR